jgi:transcriptional regulator with XRE-family HTH domain
MTTKGAIVRNWRNRMGLSRAEVARRVGTSRQNIENLEADQVKNPHYLAKLAFTMGYSTTDELLQLKEPPGPGEPRARVFVEDPAKADPDTVRAIERFVALLDKATPNTRDAVFKLLQEYSTADSERGDRILQAVKLLLDEESWNERHAPTSPSLLTKETIDQLGRGTRIEEGPALPLAKPKKDTGT